MLFLLFISIEDIFAEYESYIERLYNKLELLLANYQQLKEELKASNHSIDVLSNQLEENKQTIQQLNEKNKVLKLSSSIQGKQEITKLLNKK